VSEWRIEAGRSGAEAVRSERGAARFAGLYFAVLILSRGQGVAVSETPAFLTYSSL